MPRTSRLSLAALVAAFSALLIAPSAQAGVLVSSATSCEEQSLSQVFLPWADPAYYVLQPGGDFETNAAGWTLSGGAAVGAGNEPWKVGNATDANSLSLPAGASATSGSICVGVEHPTIRLFAKQTRGSLLTGRVDVEVLFEDAGGTVRSLPIGAVGNSSWAPSQVMVITANLLTLLPGEKTAVAFRFSADNGDFVIDDVYVDPLSKR